MPSQAEVYLLTGPDYFRKKLYLDAQKDALQKKYAGVEWRIFYIPDVRIREALDVARTFSLFNKPRFIIVRNIQRLSPTDKDILREFVAKRRLPPTTHLVLESEEYPDADTFHRQLSRHCRTHNFAPLKDRDAERWVHGLLRVQRKRIPPAALHRLVGSFGRDISGLYNAVNNLIIYTAQRDTISEADVAQFTGPDMESSVFDLVDALQEKDIPKALFVLRFMLEENKNKAPQIIGMINHCLTGMLKAKLLNNRGVREDEIISRLKVPYWRGRRFIARSRGISAAAILKIRRALREADFNIKTGRREALLELEVFLARTGKTL
jgi:DNA polymerase-3 subunit delta